MKLWIQNNIVLLFYLSIKGLWHCWHCIGGHFYWNWTHLNSCGSSMIILDWPPLKETEAEVGLYFPFIARKRPFAVAFGDLISMKAAHSHSLHLLDSVHHRTLRFRTGCKPLKQKCTLYSLVDWASLASRTMAHWHHFIYKSISVSLPYYLWDYMFA